MILGRMKVNNLHKIKTKYYILHSKICFNTALGHVEAQQMAAIIF